MLEPEMIFLTGEALESLSQWSHSLKCFQTRIGKYFARSEARLAAWDYIQALLSSVERKNGWQMAEQVGHNNPYRLQHLLGRAAWDADSVCNEVRSYVVEHLGSNDAILAVDETGFMKQGQQSVGVQVQYCGTTGHMENCQVGVFLAYISPHGHSLIDRRLYLPQSWASDSATRAKTGVPESVEFTTKPMLARAMLESAFEAGISPAWVVADEVYGSDGKFWWWLEQEYQQAYLLTVGVKQSVSIGWQQHRAGDLATSLSPEDWQRLSCGLGTKGERYYDWARIEVNCCNDHGFKRWLLFRRNLNAPDDPRSITYYQVYAPANTSLDTMATVAGQRWRIEECFKIAKDQLGLGEYEVRSWHGWLRHMTLVLAAQAFLVVLRHQTEPLVNAQKNWTMPSNSNSLAQFKAKRRL